MASISQLASFCDVRSACSPFSASGSGEIRASHDCGVFVAKVSGFSRSVLSQRQSVSVRRSMFGLPVVKKSNSPNSGTVRMALVGEEPAWNDEDYIVVGLAHCFVKDEGGKLQDMYVIEPIPAGALECMDNGGVTCYVHATPTNLGVILKQNASLLPAEFAQGKFCEDFEFRAMCASRTWKRQHAQENLMSLIEPGSVRSDWNYNVDDKRILNFIYEVSDSDNIKQDLSIDVYGRAKDEEPEAAIEKLYNA